MAAFATTDVEPLARIGLIADIQHADIADARSDYGRTRHYRDAPNKCRMAAEDWIAEGCVLAVNLGDTVDRRAGAGASSALDRVLSALQPYDRILHIMGNHDLSALPPSEWERLLPRIPSGIDVEAGAGVYFDLRIAPGWRMLLLDTYDISVKRCPDQARQLRSSLIKEARSRGQACAYLAEHEELNGAVGPEQLQWLRARLEIARAAGDHALVLSHAPLRPEPTVYQDAVCWNWQEVDAVFDAFADVVTAVITGHDHLGGTVTSAAGVLHCVLEAVMEGDKATPTHAILDVYPNGIALRGKGAVQSWERALPVR